MRRLKANACNAVPIQTFNQQEMVDRCAESYDGTHVVLLFQ